jgi:hypothetical protein
LEKQVVGQFESERLAGGRSALDGLPLVADGGDQLAQKLIALSEQFCLPVSTSEGDCHQCKSGE